MEPPHWVLALVASEDGVVAPSNHPMKRPSERVPRSVRRAKPTTPQTERRFCLMYSLLQKWNTKSPNFGDSVGGAFIRHLSHSQVPTDPAAGTEDERVAEQLPALTV